MGDGVQGGSESDLSGIDYQELSENATGHVTGTFTIPSLATPCTTITVTGKQTGRGSVMGDSQNLLIVVGESDVSNKNINNDSAGGSCVPNSSFSMTRP